MCDNTASGHSDETMLGAHRCGSLINSKLCVYKPLGPISHPVVKRWLLKPAFKHSLTSVYLSFSISHPVVKH